MMGLINYFKNRTRRKLEFEGIDKEIVQRHFDLFCEHGYTGFKIRAEDELIKIFNNSIKEADYVCYLFDKAERYIRY